MIRKFSLSHFPSLPEMKFMDELDIELVNQELNFQSPDNNLVIKGGCDLFTTKAIGSDKKLFKTIDKHVEQILEDHQLSQSIDRERKQSVNSIFGSSASPPPPNFVRKRSSSADIPERERRSSSNLFTFNKSDFIETADNIAQKSNLSLSLLGDYIEEYAVDESPFGPLKKASTRKTFAYLIAILNATYPDHDFSDLQPSTENFHKLENSEDLMNRFNSEMISLGKREDLLTWIWDTINVHMDIIRGRSPKILAQNVSENRKSSFSNANSPRANDLATHMSDPECKIYEFQPSDLSILEDINHPYQTMWSYYWFIYNKRRKRVCFLYLTAIKSSQYLPINRSATPLLVAGAEILGRHTRNPDDEYGEDFMEEDMNDIDSNDVIGDIEI